MGHLATERPPTHLLISFAVSTLFKKYKRSISPAYRIKFNLPIFKFILVYKQDMNTEHLKDLDKLIKESKSQFSNEQLIELAKKNDYTKFIGLIDSSENIKNILKARKFLKPSSFYGHMYGENISTAWNMRPSEGIDVFETDSNGILKNSINSEDAILRIQKAKKNNTPIFYIFGGSTVMSLGSGIPNFSIPSLIEKISKKRYQKEIVCVNFGLGGTSSQEAFNLMIYKAFKLAKPTSVVFYDGWNCSTYLAIMHVLKNKNNKDKKITFCDGENLQNVEHNITLNSSYDLFWMLARTLKLFLANFISTISSLIKLKIISKIFNILQSKFFSLKIKNINVSVINKLKDCGESEIKNMIPDLVSEYIDIHKYAHEICKSQKINFYWIFQPLVFYGKKKLGKRELIFKKNRLSSFQPKFYENFYKELKNKLFNDSEKYNFSDLTNIFDDVEDQTYIDSGHLNKFGNLIVASKITDIIMHKND